MDIHQFYECGTSDLDDEFMDFLRKTKENLIKPNQRSDNEDSTDDEESDSAFMKFVTEMKKGLPIEFENENMPGSPIFSKNRTLLNKHASESAAADDRLRDTLLHEMCHAAVWVVNKQKDNHGPLWQTWASRCNLILPNVDVPTRCHNYEINYKFTYRCKNCPWKVGRHSKCSKLLESKCPKCHGSIYCVKS
ncbi:unnamed protein product [Larinioides sclopetarius]|uniref:SprT-like domain-containing protein n=1 Tax=Larinioides sclopetarius TaxID=280406 RepID=A0AAV1ZCA2_9ARAC